LTNEVIFLHPILYAGFVCAWGALLLVWFARMPFSKRTARRASYSSRLILFGPPLAGYLLVVLHAIPGHWLFLRLWPNTPAVQAAGLVLTVLGCLFAIWARVTLGTNWSGIPDVKQEHELIVRGPYAFVRHPIYTGILLALAGTFLAADRSECVLFWGLIAVSYAFKIRQEEHFMNETFPAAYPEYKRHVKALIPGIL
jgi:protein-S-isoprenylcysteine O-methyltransferase Ste14